MIDEQTLIDALDARVRRRTERRDRIATVGEFHVRLCQFD